ncbi:hypothetical protein ALP71_03107 [Pseudomonas coronafaciens pv. garcae]|nr:hypothetical protein ALP71_03107 [Pseudomonas coronafaciens pv. garcae]
MSGPRVEGIAQRLAYEYQQGENQRERKKRSQAQPRCLQVLLALSDQFSK